MSKSSVSWDSRIAVRRNLFGPQNSSHSGSVILTEGGEKKRCAKSGKWVKAQTRPGQGSQGILKAEEALPSTVNAAGKHSQ